MTIFFVFLALFLYAGFASAMGWSADSRDSRFTVGRLLDGRPVGGHRGG